MKIVPFQIILLFYHTRSLKNRLRKIDAGGQTRRKQKYKENKTQRKSASQSLPENNGDPDYALI